MKPQIEVADDLLSFKHIMKIQIGDVCCSLRCNDSDIFGNLRQLHGNFLSDRSVDINIEVEVIDQLNPTDIEAALAEAIFTKEGNCYTTSNRIITLEHDPVGHNLSMTVEKSLFDPFLEFKLMNQIFPIVYYTACEARYSGRPPAMLVHSCGIIRHGRMLMFAGPCEVGKTTIARLCGEEHGRVLNDEMLLVSRPHEDNGPFRAQGVPIIGGFPQRLNEVAPLGCVLMLKQSRRTAVRRLDRLEAYQRFMRQVISPQHLGHSDRWAILSLISEFSDEVTRTTPFYELEFALDRERLWEEVGKLERSLGKEGEHEGKPDNLG